MSIDTLIQHHGELIVAKGRMAQFQRHDDPVDPAAIVIDLRVAYEDFTSEGIPDLVTSEQVLAMSGLTSGALSRWNRLDVIHHASKKRFRQLGRACYMWSRASAFAAMICGALSRERVSLNVTRGIAKAIVQEMSKSESTIASGA